MDHEQPTPEEHEEPRKHGFLEALLGIRGEAERQASGGAHLAG